MVVVARPSPLGVVPSQLIVSTTAMVETMVAILVTTKAASVVTLVAPPPLAMTEEERETRLPTSPGEGLHGSPSRSELKAPEGDVARTELEHGP